MPVRIRVHYAIKANSFRAASRDDGISWLDGLDIASGGELAIALAAGADPTRVSFAGPGKRDDELEAAIAAGVTLNLESEGEARRALTIADRLGITPRLAIRVNPDFDLRGSGMKMGGGARQFGIDADRVATLAREIIAAGCEWRGLHIFAGSQALDAEAVIAAQIGHARSRRHVSRGTSARQLPALNLGGGFGIPYFAGDASLDIALIGAALAERCDDTACNARQSRTRHRTRPLSRREKPGVYLTRIVDRKESRGETFLITDGGLHHQLAASGNFGTVVRRNYPLAIASRFSAPATEVAHVVGCLCTPLDRLADRAYLPKADVGDLVAVFCAGAYGASASPSAFLGHVPAAEMLV